MRRLRITMSGAVMPPSFCKRADLPDGNLAHFCSGRACSVVGVARRKSQASGSQTPRQSTAPATAITGCYAAGGGRHVPRELAHVLWRGLREAGDVASAGEVLAFGAQHDAASSLASSASKVMQSCCASVSGDDVEGRAVQHDWRARVNLIAVAIEGGAQGERGGGGSLSCMVVSVRWG